MANLAKRSQAIASTPTRCSRSPANRPEHSFLQPARSVLGCSTDTNKVLKYCGTRNSLSSVFGEKGSLAPQEKEFVFCTDKTRLWFAQTATRNSHSPRASSSSTRIANSANRVDAHRVAPPRRQLAAIAAAAATRIVVAPAAATPAARAKCLAQPARPAAARPRFHSGLAAPSRSTAAIASPASEARATATRPQLEIHRKGARSLGLLFDSGIRCRGERRVVRAARPKLNDCRTNHFAVHTNFHSDSNPGSTKCKWGPGVGQRCGADVRSLLCGRLRHQISTPGQGMNGRSRAPLLGPVLSRFESLPRNCIGMRVWPGRHYAAGATRGGQNTTTRPARLAARGNRRLSTQSGHSVPGDGSASGLSLSPPVL